MTPVTLRSLAHCFMLIMLLLNGSGMLKFVHLACEHGHGHANAHCCQHGDCGEDASRPADCSGHDHQAPDSTRGCPICQLLATLVLAQASPPALIAESMCACYYLADPPQIRVIEVLADRSPRAPPLG